MKSVSSPHGGWTLATVKWANFWIWSSDDIHFIRRQKGTSLMDGLEFLPSRWIIYDRLVVARSLPDKLAVSSSFQSLVLLWPSNQIGVNRKWQAYGMVRDAPGNERVSELFRLIRSANKISHWCRVYKKCDLLKYESLYRNLVIECPSRGYLDFSFKEVMVSIWRGGKNLYSSNGEFRSEWKVIFSAPEKINFDYISQSDSSKYTASKLIIFRVLETIFGRSRKWKDEENLEIRALFFGLLGE